MTQPDDNSNGLVPASGRQLAAVGAAPGNIPTLFLRSAHSGKRFWEFFTSNIRNRNMRRAYFVAVSRFSDWCEQRKLTLEQVQPIHVAAYIEQLGAKHTGRKSPGGQLAVGVHSERGIQGGAGGDLLPSADLLD